MLKNKKILLAVCGSIAFYKAFEILSLLKKQGADVYVALSDGALKFCSINGFEALSSHRVLSSMSEDWQNGVNHIAYAKMDLVLVAPASVNTINSLANGICDNIFMQTLIASPAPLVIAPAANDKMISHFATQKSLKFLADNDVSIVEPMLKTLACGDIGKGGLAEPEIIVQECIRKLNGNEFKGQKIVITGGATTENIDDVRGITNFSSGKMAKALADAFYYAGADVVLVASFETQNLPYRVSQFRQTAELLQICKDECKNAQILVMCAAISDYVCEQKFNGKLKKDELGDRFVLNLVKNLDVLENLKELKCKKIGFKLEFDAKNAEANAKNMLNAKTLDAVCLNIISSENKFGSELNEVTFITKNSQTTLKMAEKSKIAMQIAKLAKEL
ncbi:bifunctional phosphopantothenoylcysteine decarboxylase/phosphopantothenate--cysteine ligase CoaBC [Campylobacter sp. faydin G-24]|uniref:Coenzyme A biosynthesis bifunctional protein CoaBC n=1 Tax=Campylobacter anatolicus TaxID=2829105 RepID=A0ABS5HIB8_9BACT|nr:bifunctional phosphopantothenoylcysteine decarboxylase/phosphopantothenate--cysteine ligase CoaBC [Campylobacter anatolicus]MBR8464018.1 bifunctional phosphopantothenoylcysteine decarboxylase/phosphopantothenate--cysteine ligase CoaBC [Campylobacter anatolicus]MBR8465794.1 bifunctional phosphopantothenoylcysteine decarboxylase/phosphopantothenate--cysteine ligase CoaBC [Campylobacter anatolicus]